MDFYINIFNIFMCNFLIPLLFSLSFSQNSDSIYFQSTSKFVDLRKMNNNEKVAILMSINNNYNEYVIYCTSYSLEVQNIINVDRDSVEVELLDYWWWNKPIEPVFYNASPIERMTKKNQPSFIKKLAIQDIIAIKILLKKPLFIFVLPVLLVLFIMKSIGL